MARQARRSAFTRREIARNLLGGFEAALFMPQARARFEGGRHEALRSFIMPALLSPLALASAGLYPGPPHAAVNNVAVLIFSLRLAASWALFLGCVYWLLQRIGRGEHFCRFVTAVNWLSVPAAAAFLPTAWLLSTGAYSWQELRPFLVCTEFYTCAFTAFLAARILRIPWEFGGFIVLIGVMANNYMADVASFIGHVL